MSSQSISRLSKKQDNLINLVFVLTFAFSICIFFGRDVFTDPDVGWHIKAGEIIWNTLSIPTHDTLTFTSDQEWYNLSWTWDVVIYWIFNAFGTGGLVCFQALLFALAVAAIYLTALSFKEFDSDTKAIITALGALLIWDVLYLRPQLLSYVFAIAVLSALSKRKYIYLIPIITIIWANIHGSFIVVYTILFAFILEALYEKNYDWLKSLVLVAVLASAAPLINPLGYKIIIGIARTLDSVIVSYINEWMPFTFGREYAASLVIMVLLMTGGFANDKIPIAHRILACLWLIAALISKRSFGFFGVLAIPYLGYVLMPLVIKSPSKIALNKTTKLGIIWILTGLSALSPIIKDHIPYFKSESKTVPFAAINYINQNCGPLRLFNDYNIGGYLALWGKDEIKHFIDGRAGTVFSETFLKKYLDAAAYDSDVATLLAEYPIDAALFSNEFARRISYHKYFANWETIYQDDKVTMYQRRGSKVCKKSGTHRW